MRGTDLKLLRPTWVPCSFVADEECKQTLKVWLTDGNYYVEHSPPNLSLYCLDNDELMKSFSLDAFRFAAHAAQTVYEVEKTSAYAKLTSWRVIQVYYAAFYAAHAALRFFGRSFSHLENGHVKFLGQRCNSEAGYTPTLPSTYYLIRYQPAKRTVEFIKHGESHKDLWKSFLSLISDLEQESLTLRASEQRRQEISAHFSDLGAALTNRGQFSAGNWLSSVRNEVNYKSAASVWYPFSRSTPSFEQLLRKVRGWQSGKLELGNPSTVRSELDRFFLTAFAVIDFGISLSLDYQRLVGMSGRRSASFSKIVNLAAAA